MWWILTILHPLGAVVPQVAEVSTSSPYDYLITAGAVFAPFGSFLIWLYKQKVKEVKAKDKALERVNERLVDQVNLLAPLVADATRVLANATMQLERLRRD